jgi:hypothetical protein
MYVREAIDNLFQDKFGQQPSDVAQRACSFCDRREPEIRLAAGAKGFICDACVSTLAEVFKEPTDK